MKKYLLLILPVIVIWILLYIFVGDKEDHTDKPYNNRLEQGRKYEECNYIYTYNWSWDFVCCDLPWGLCELFNDEMTCVAEVYSDKTAYLKVWWDECIWELSISRWLASWSYLVDY